MPCNDCTHQAQWDRSTQREQAGDTGHCPLAAVHPPLAAPATHSNGADFGQRAAWHCSTVATEHAAPGDGGGGGGDGGDGGDGGGDGGGEGGGTGGDGGPGPGLTGGRFLDAATHAILVELPANTAVTWLKWVHSAVALSYVTATHLPASCSKHRPTQSRQ